MRVVHQAILGTEIATEDMADTEFIAFLSQLLSIIINKRTSHMQR